MKNVIILFISTIIFFTACKKTSPSVSGELMGTWQMIRYAYDLNGNGYPDGSEWHRLDSISSSGYLTLRSDYTGFRYQLTGILVDSASFNWTVGDNYLILKDLDGTQSGLHLDTINFHSLVVKDTSGGYLHWVSMTK